MPKIFRSPIVQLLSVILIGVVVYRIGYQRGVQKNTIHQTEAAKELIEKNDSTSTTVNPEQLVPTSHTPTATKLNQPANVQGWEGGYALAETDLESALQRATSLPYHKQLEFVTGIFSYLAENRSPSEAMNIANTQTGRLREMGLKTLATEWILAGGNVGNEDSHRQHIMELSSGPFGLEASLASIIANANLDPSIETAWKDSFSSHPGRSEIAARFAAARATSNSDFSLEIEDNWTEWEKKRFTESVLQNWSQLNSTAAWKWYSKNEHKLSSNSENQLFRSWARQNPQQVIEEFETMETQGDRTRAIDAITSSLSTFDALDWAESLPNVGERERAIKAAHDKALVGIGARVSINNGYTKIARVIPGGAIESTNLRQGDIFIEASEPNREPVNFYGANFGTIINTLRGGYGTTIEVRVLRANEATGNLEEHTVTVERDLLEVP